MYLNQAHEIASQLFRIEEQGALVTSSSIRFGIGSSNVLVDGWLSAVYLEFNVSDSVTINGEVDCDTLLLSRGALINRGVVAAVSTLAISVYANYLLNWAHLECGYLATYRVVGNEGVLVCDSAAVGEFYSQTGSTTVNGSMLAFIDLGILGPQASLMVSDDLQLVQYMENYGSISCGHLLNGDTVGTAISRIYGTGVVQCEAFTNAESGRLYGPGTLCVAGHSENHGLVGGPVRICDATPTSSTPPFMDVHDGALLLPIYGCSSTVCASLGLPETPFPAYAVLSPQPATESFTITLSDPEDVASIILIDATGRIMRSIAGPFSGTVGIDRENLQSGLYIVMINDRIGRPITSTRAVFADH